MKKITTLLFAVLLAVTSYSQNAESKLGIGVNLGLYNYYGDFGSELVKFKEATPGLELGLKYYLSPSFNLAGTYSRFSVDYLDLFDHKAQDFDLALEYKFANGYILKEDAKLKPFLTAGFGVLHDRDPFAMIPLGGGVRYQIVDALDLLLQARYKITPDGDTYSYFTTSIGLVFTPKSKKDSDGDGVSDKLDKCPMAAGSIAMGGCPDSDKDGIADKEDACPNTAGVMALNGCPDTDGDGITDLEDACPNVKGTKENKGCPDTDGDGILDKDDSCPKVAGTQQGKGCPDTDGDGVVDKDDNCPNDAGLSKNQGCPEKDTDGDGVLDKNDACPSIAGTVQNGGCPELNEKAKEILKEALEGVQFKSGSDVLLNSSYEKLDKVAQLMSENPTYRLKISGYTDNTGNANSNLQLSKRRAAATKQYLIKDGIDGSRMDADGYGIINPVADNNTSAGRSKNRRVEFEVIF